MVTKLNRLTFLVGLALLCSCVSNRSTQTEGERVTERYSKLLRQATEFILRQKEHHRLPGGEADINTLQVNSEGIMDAQGQLLKTEISFPIKFTAQTSDDSGPAYRYKVTKENEQAKWRIDGTWKKENQTWVELK